MQNLSKPSISEEFARFALRASFKDLTPADVLATKHCIYDQLGAQLVAAALPWSRIVFDYARSVSSDGPCSISGEHARMSALEAAFVNATFGQGCEIDDFGHSGAATVPVALAVGEQRKISGREFLTLVAIGYEVFYRIYDAVMPQILERGFHQQAVIGVFASAAIAGRALGLTEDQLVHALGIAGSHACGTAEYDQSGGEVKRMHAGLGARGGIQAALLAQLGLTGPKAILEGDKGILRTFVDRFRTESLEAGFENGFTFRPRIAFKAYPAVGTTQTAIDGMRQLVEKHNLQPSEVKNIRIGMRAYALKHGAGVMIPADVVGAQFSVAFSVALRIAKRSSHLRYYTDSTVWRDPEILALIQRTEPYADDRLIGERGYGSFVSVDTQDGRRLEIHQDARRGSADLPFTNQEVEDKFRSLAEGVIPTAQINRLVEMVDALEDLDDVRKLGRLMTPPEPH